MLARRHLKAGDHADISRFLTSRSEHGKPTLFSSAPDLFMPLTGAKPTVEVAPQPKPMQPVTPKPMRRPTPPEYRSRHDYLVALIAEKNGDVAPVNMGRLSR